MTNIAVAGTFNKFHKGHKEMINTAFGFATEPEDRVFIGITTDFYASLHKDVLVRSYNNRCADVLSYVVSSIGRDCWNVFEVNEPLMLHVMENIDILVVSEETKENGNCICSCLAKEGKKLKLIVVPLVKNVDGTKLSATDIINKKYDEEGNRIGNAESCGESVFRCNRCQTPCKLTIRKDGVITPYMCPFSNYAADWEEVHMPDGETEEVKRQKQTDCKKCIYKFNIKPFRTTDKYYEVDGMRMDYGPGENKNNITDDKCSKCMRMDKPFCPLFDDGKDVKQ